VDFFVKVENICEIDVFLFFAVYNENESKCQIVNKKTIYYACGLSRGQINKFVNFSDLVIL